MNPARQRWGTMLEWEMVAKAAPQSGFTVMRRTAAPPPALIAVQDLMPRQTATTRPQARLSALRSGPTRALPHKAQPRWGRMHKPRAMAARPLVPSPRPPAHTVLRWGHTPVPQDYMRRPWAICRARLDAPVPHSAPALRRLGITARLWGDTPARKGWKRTAVGAYSRAQGLNATALGAGSSAQGVNATAVGIHSSAVASNSLAMGASSVVATGATGSVAIGANSSATAANAVALGAGSVANRANTVSVGATGNFRQITGVADGTQANDAVNLEQLQSVAGRRSIGAGGCQCFHDKRDQHSVQYRPGRVLDSGQTHQQDRGDGLGDVEHGDEYRWSRRRKSDRRGRRIPRRPIGGVDWISARVQQQPC